MSLIFNPRMKPRLGTPINKAISHKLGLVGCWLFNEAGGGQAFDLSGNGNTGTLVGDTHFVPGKFGSCLNFDGDNDYVDTINSSSQDFASGFTLSAWVKPANTDSDGRIIYRYDAASKDGYFLTQSSTGVGIWGFYVLVNPTFDTALSNSAPTGNWQHIVGVRENDGTLKLYVDGVLQTNTGTMAGAIDSNDGLRIGIDISNSRDFNGQIDNVMIFNRALSANEIQQLYREPFCMFQRELIELWAASGGAPPAGHPYYYREFANRRIA